ncbi:hypothetical protein I307_01121 [Cryptococcus deuterogattii 99/473]|uniref:Uncharacterized protein n=1 Tax=Cryptococcus deuterogattii Ram5 TaxID=1296110 RepID=A0A0D0V5X5_9TREE|nr:hypothetical protein I313_00974 [Cryptococcus deuterogattii Ram5]KIS02140.1 hypothetical protein L804_00400 [Cryptococcus deuterogattii 2001/935-1]KIY59452.1 hypothetical protein I307_01121 [Cryptococcus deuterogattii 99/473]
MSKVSGHLCRMLRNEATTSEERTSSTRRVSGDATLVRPTFAPPILLRLSRPPVPSRPPKTLLMSGLYSPQKDPQHPTQHQQFPPKPPSPSSSAWSGNFGENPVFIGIGSAVGASALTLLGVMGYRRYWRRIKNADYVTSELLRRRAWIKGIVTRLTLWTKVAVPYISRRLWWDRPLPLMMLKEGMAVVYKAGGAEYGPWGLDGMLKVEAEARYFGHRFSLDTLETSNGRTELPLLFLLDLDSLPIPWDGSGAGWSKRNWNGRRNVDIGANRFKDNTMQTRERPGRIGIPVQAWL